VDALIIAVAVIAVRTSAWRCRIRIQAILAAACLLAGTLPSLAAPASDIPPPGATAPAPPPTPKPPVSPPAITPPETTQTREAWRQLMARTPAPKPGCYTATYPSAILQEVPCTTAPERPYPRAIGAGPATVGAGGSGDFSATATGGPITLATGSLNVTGVTSVSDGSGPNTFSLQLNTNTFKTKLCANQQGCVGWQQFIFSNSSNCKSGGSCVFIQYWLINHTSPCPSTPTVAGNIWNFSPATAGAAGGCFINGQAAPVPNQTALNFGGLILTGDASSGGQSAQVETSAGTFYKAADPGDLVAIGGNWTTAEFNLFGDCCTKLASFNTPGATVVIKTILNSGGVVAAPTCASQSFTAESNNLILQPPCCPLSGGITFTESNAAGASSACACQAGTSWDPNGAVCVPLPPVPPACTIAFSCPDPQSHSPPQYEVTCPNVVDFYEALPSNPKYPLQTAASLSGTTDAYGDIIFACITGTQTCRGFSIYKDVTDWCGGPPPSPNPNPNPQQCCESCRAAGGTCTAGAHSCICQ